MIFGVDLGTRRIALACPTLKWAASHHVPDSGKRKVVIEDAGMQLGQWAEEVISDLYPPAAWTDDPPVFYAEMPFAGFLPGGKRNIKTAIGQGISAGAVRSFLPGRLILIDQSQWKKELIGDGSTRAADYVQWLAQHHPALAEVCQQDEDAHAATCIALWAEMASPGLVH